MKFWQLTFVIVLSLKTAVTAGYQDVIRVSSVFSHSDRGSNFCSALSLWCNVDNNTGDDIPGESLEIDGIAPEVLAVRHRDVVEVVFADSQDVSDCFQFLYKHGKHVSDLMAGCRIWRWMVMILRFLTKSSYQLALLSLNGFFTCHHRHPGHKHQDNKSPSPSLSSPPLGCGPAYSLFRSANLPEQYIEPGILSQIKTSFAIICWVLFKPAFIPRTPQPPLPGAARRTKHNFRATSKAGSPLCAAASTSLWVALMWTLTIQRGSPMGAMGERSAHFRNCAM